jgi:Protein of unknown function (DUF723)
MLNNFVYKATQIHGIRYDYGLVKYRGSKFKIKIVCLEHGLFKQTPNKHLSGQGCPQCSKQRKKTPAEFRARAIQIHGSKYDYSKTDFTHIKNKVVIICPIHGIFLQVLDKHINSGHGCSDCGGSRKKTQKEFLVEAKSIHGELYDYSLSQYINFEEKLIIVCRKHGQFYQTPNNHLTKKRGCPHCTHRISKVETAWLDYIGVPNDSLHRNVLIKLDDKKIKADGYEPTTTTIYEFYGDYYHGNPKFYKSDITNPHTKCTFGELYQRTLEKEQLIIMNGFKLVCIWEHEWKSK